MKPYLWPGLFVASVVFVPPSAEAQSLQNIHASFQDGKVLISYDLTGGNPQQKYNLNLYGSHNNYRYALSSVKGDVGTNISGGIGKRIEWNAAEKLAVFSGEITFKIKGEAVAL